MSTLSMRATISTLELYNQTMRLQPRQANSLGYKARAKISSDLPIWHIRIWRHVGQLAVLRQFRQPRTVSFNGFFRVGERRNPTFVWHAEYRYFEAPTEPGTAKRDTLSVHINSPSKRDLDIHITPIATS